MFSAATGWVTVPVVDDERGPGSPGLAAAVGETQPGTAAIEGDKRVGDDELSVGVDHVGGQNKPAEMLVGVTDMDRREAKFEPAGIGDPAGLGRRADRPRPKQFHIAGSKRSAS